MQSYAIVYMYMYIVLVQMICTTYMYIYVLYMLPSRAQQDTVGDEHGVVPRRKVLLPSWVSVELAKPGEGGDAIPHNERFVLKTSVNTCETDQQPPQ